MKLELDMDELTNEELIRFVKRWMDCEYERYREAFAKVADTPPSTRKEFAKIFLQNEVEIIRFAVKEWAKGK